MPESENKHLITEVEQSAQMTKINVEFKRVTEPRKKLKLLGIKKETKKLDAFAGLSDFEVAKQKAAKIRE